MLVHSLKYSLKVWLTTGIISPVLIRFISLFTPKTSNPLEMTSGEFFFLYVVFGLVFSLPSAIPGWLLINLLSYYGFSVHQIKTILVTFAVAADFFSFALFFEDKGFLKDSSNLTVWLLYTITVSAGIVFFSLKPASSFPKNNTE